jgi:hypothetical protein
MMPLTTLSMVVLRQRSDQQSIDIEPHAATSIKFDSLSIQRPLIPTKAIGSLP